MTTALSIYRAAAWLAEPALPLLLRARARRGKEDPQRLGERLGFASAPRPAGPLVWMHGASVGETLSLLPLIATFKAARPGLSVLVTSGTTTSAELLARRLPEGAVHQYLPVDAPKAVARFLDHWRPDLAVLVESELWPNLIFGAHRRGASLALISARLSAASLKGWGRAAGTARALLAPFALVMAQDDAAAGRLSALGARDDGRLNLKLVGDPLPFDPSALERARAAARGRPVLVAASTHPGEETQVLDAWTALKDRPDRPLLVVAPRHPARGEAVAALAAADGRTVRRDGAGQPFDGVADVHVADTLGELGLWLRLASAALVGGSLVGGVGGHNPLEAARLGTPFVSGPHVENWRDVYAALAGSDALRTVRDAEELTAAFAEILDDPAGAGARAGRALAFADQGRRTLLAALPKLLRLLP